MREENRLIVVTGGAGFIGSGVIRHLNEIGKNNILIVDDLGKTEKWKNLVGKRVVDIISKHHLFSWLEGREELISAFIHLGACSSTVELDADYLLENNYRYSQRLADYAIKHKKRFIYASSAATYGDGTEDFADDEGQIDRLKPLNMYGFSKHLFDLWLKNQGYLIHVVGVKYFNVFGPNEWHKGRMASAILHLFHQIQKEGVIRLFKSSEPEFFADGEQKRDFVYVKDAARMTCGFLQNEATGLYNIGRGTATTWNALATAVFDAMERPVNIEYIPMPVDLLGKYQNYTCADMQKTSSILNSQARSISLTEAVLDYVRNHLIPGKTW